MNELRMMLEKLKEDPESVEKLQEEVKKRNLSEGIKDFEKQYAGRINEFIASLNEKGEMTNEQKARMVLEMKNRLPKQSQEQFSAVVSAMKDYLKKM